MTDTEITKALWCCVNGNQCSKCPLRAMNCSDNVAMAFAIDLINRQKAEIERLKNENNILSKNADTAFQDGLNEAQDLYAEQIKSEIITEAIKEFAERLCDGRVSNDLVVIAVNAELEMLQKE